MNYRAFCLRPVPGRFWKAGGTSGNGGRSPPDRGRADGGPVAKRGQAYARQVLAAGAERAMVGRRTPRALPLSCHWPKAENAQGFGDGIPQE